MKQKLNLLIKSDAQLPNLSIYPQANDLQSIFKHSPRRPFTVSEDVQLLNIISKSTDLNWAQIAKQLGHRTARQCRDRWFNYLNPNINDDPWTNEEDLVLLNKVNELGCCWSIIRRFFRGRSESNVKNRWYSHLKYQVIKKEGKFQFISDPTENQYPNRKKRQRVKTSPHLYARAILEQNNKEMQIQQNEQAENNQNSVDNEDNKKHDNQRMLSIDFLLV